MHLEGGGGDSGSNYYGKPVDEYGAPLSEPSTATFKVGAVALNERSYILADLSTVWNADGTITGGVDGKYLGATRTGALNGPFYGAYLQQSYEQDDGYGGYSGYGGWAGIGIGTFEGTNLLFGGEVVGPGYDDYY